MRRRAMCRCPWLTQLHVPPARRTYLEADAYLAWMQGTFSLEKESWTEAYEAFERSRLIYEQVGD